MSLFGGVIGAGVTSFFASRREHRRWIFDQKRVEYRDLLDGLHECMQQMSAAFLPISVTSPGTDPNSGMRHGYVLIHSRIFTAAALAKFEIKRRWKELCAHVIEAQTPRAPTQRGGPTMASFNLRAGQFEDELANFVREDLGIG